MEELRTPVPDERPNLPYEDSSFELPEGYSWIRARRVGWMILVVVVMVGGALFLCVSTSFLYDKLIWERSSCVLAALCP